MCTGLLTSHPLIIFYCISSSLIISPLLSSLPILPLSSLLFTSRIPLTSSHLLASYLSLSFESLSSLIIRPRPLSSSPLRKPHLSSSYVLLNRCNFTARNQKHQNLNLETAFFVFACIHLLSTSCTFVRSNNFNLHLISSNVCFSHLLSSSFISSKTNAAISRVL